MNRYTFTHANKRIFKSRLLLIFFTLCIHVTLLPSCSMTTKIISEHDCNTIDNDPTNKKTSWSFAWGLVQAKTINPRCDSAFNHLNKVEVKTNLGFILLSAVTLGAVVPQRVVWCCAPPDPPTEDLGLNNGKK